jgi:hypothetical protein
MITQIVPSLGQQCGIASFSEKLSYNMVKELKEKEVYDTIILEYEYGLHKDINFEAIKSAIARHKVVIMHAYNTELSRTLHNEIFSTFDRIIFLTTSAKVAAGSAMPMHLHKMFVIEHYSEEYDNSFKEFIPNITMYPVIGVHGFGFPRNGFGKILNQYVNSDVQFKAKLYLMMTLSSFNPTANTETSIYIDKIRRFVWDNKLEDRVVIDCNYYETKQEIISKLREKCNLLYHDQYGPKTYINTSGSIHTLLSTGLPVYAINTVRIEMIPEGVVSKINTLEDIFDSKIEGVDRERLSSYLNSNSVEAFKQKLLRIINGTNTA